MNKFYVNVPTENGIVNFEIDDPISDIDYSKKNIRITLLQKIADCWPLSEYAKNCEDRKKYGRNKYNSYRKSIKISELNGLNIVNEIYLYDGLFTDVINDNSLVYQFNELEMLN